MNSIFYREKWYSITVRRPDAFRLHVPGERRVITLSRAALEKMVRAHYGLKQRASVNQ